MSHPSHLPTGYLRSTPSGHWLPSWYRPRIYGRVSTLHGFQHLLILYVLRHLHIRLDNLLLRRPQLQSRQQNVQERLDFNERKSHPYTRLANSQIHFSAP